MIELFGYEFLILLSGILFGYLFCLVVNDFNDF